MKLVRGAWKLLVGIKDALVLVLMLLFFGALFAAFSARPAPTAIRDGALVLDLDGSIVEQPAEIAPFAALSGQPMTKEFRQRDLIRAIDAAKDDARVKAIVLDLDGFAGGYPALVGEVADALARVRAGGKPVLAYAAAYTDAGYRLAAAASEIWVNPMGGALFTGPGGSQLYYKGLIDRLGVTTHIYRVGKYKSFVEPYLRADQSPDARAAAQALYGTFLSSWRESVGRLRPKAQVTAFQSDPARAVLAANGDVARANLQAGIVDTLGDRLAFGKRVAQLAGADTPKGPGVFKTIRYDDYVASKPVAKSGAIGVVTVAGDIVDGRADSGSAGGDTIAKFITDGLAKGNLKALVVRVDSPGGSVPASETIRQAVIEAKRRGLPIVVSMGGVAASGGYWVATAGDAIFAEPTTITGSIGVFGIIPTFERALAKIGVTADGVKTTPLSGQPDVFAGTSPAIDAVIQAGVENAYRDFIGRVAQARRMTPARVNDIAQGRVWDGGTARQLGLVDRFGTLGDAVAEAARRAKLDPKTAEVQYLEKQPGWFEQLAAQMGRKDDANAPGDAVSRIAQGQRQLLAQALGDVRRLALSTAATQARCLECGGLGAAQARAEDRTLFAALLARFGL